MKLVGQVGSEKLKNSQQKNSPSEGLVIHTDQCIDIYSSSKSWHTGKTVVLLKHARALEQIKSLSVALNSATKQSECKKCKKVRPGLTWLHDSRNKLLSKIQQIQEEKRAIINENRKLNEFLREKNNVICGLRRDVNRFNEEKREYTEQLKLMKAHMKDITAKELSNREAVRYLTEDVKNANYTSVTQKKTMEARIQVLNEENRNLQEKIVQLNLEHEEQENSKTKTNVPGVHEQSILHAEIISLKSEIDHQREKTKIASKQKNEMYGKYRDTVYKLRLLEKQLERFRTKNKFPASNSLMLPVNKADGISHIRKEPTITMDWDPDEERVMAESEDFSAKIRLLGNEKLRLSAALGKLRHKDLVMRGKHRNRPGIGKKRLHAKKHEHRKLAIL
eukprot:g16253.t1